MTVRTLMLFGIDGVLLAPGGTTRSPGAAEALAALRHRGDVVLSVMTEEPADAAQRRLTEVGLERYLDVTVGAFGTDTVAVARDRACESYGELTTVVVVVATRDEVLRARPGADVVVAAVHADRPPGELLDGLHADGADHLVTDLRDAATLGSAYAG